MTSWTLFPTVYKTSDYPHVLPCVPKKEVPVASCRAQRWHWSLHVVLCWEWTKPQLVLTLAALERFLPEGSVRPF